MKRKRKPGLWFGKVRSSTERSESGKAHKHVKVGKGWGYADTGRPMLTVKEDRGPQA